MSQMHTQKFAQTSMWPAEARWREHVLMYVARDTRACKLSAIDSINHFPATPYICITWMLEGELHLLRQGQQERDQCLPKVCVVGCQSQHGVTLNVGDRHSFMAVFFSDAFHALFKLDLSSLQDQFVDAKQLLGAEACTLIDAVEHADNHAQRRQLIEDFLVLHAADLTLTPWPRLRRLGSNFSLQIASSLLGVGERQTQRRIRREACLSLVGLSRLWRAKRSHAAVKQTLAQDGELNWAQHASAQGYVDQSHMVKECKKLSGRSPQQLVDAVKKDENLWMYRL